MNWKKILAFLGATAVSGGLTPYLQSTTSGHPIAFTAGNVMVPMALTAATTFIALFTKPPHQDGS
jgi:hypothetical protein